MIEELIKIANAITIIAIVCFSAYLWALTKEMKYTLIQALIQLCRYRNNEPIEWIWNNKKYLAIYIIVPCLLAHNVVLISQFYNGLFKIRLDYSFFLNAVLWICLIVFVKGMHDDYVKLKKETDGSSSN